MTDMLFQIHMWFGYVVAAVVLVSAALGFGRANDAREFAKGPYSGAMVLLDIQVLLGLVLYGMAQYWEADPLIAYVHPTLALVALAAGHAMVGRARKQQQVVDAHRTAARGLLTALVFVAAAIVVAVIG